MKIGDEFKAFTRELWRRFRGLVAYYRRKNRKLMEDKNYRLGRRWVLRCHGLMVGVAFLAFFFLGLETARNEPIYLQFILALVNLSASALGFGMFIYSFKMRR